MYGSTLDRALMVAAIFLPALIAAALAVLAKHSIWLTIRILGVAGLIALLAGLAFYDIVTNFGSAHISGLSLGAGGLHEYLAAGLLLATERWLFIAALALALWDAASCHAWWWAAGLAATLVAGVAFFAALLGLPVFDLFGGLLAFALRMDNHTAGQEQLFSIMVETLMALAYAPALFYASRAGGSISEEALAVTIQDR